RKITETVWGKGETQNPQTPQQKPVSTEDPPEIEPDSETVQEMQALSDEIDLALQNGEGLSEAEYLEKLNRIPPRLEGRGEKDLANGAKLYQKIVSQSAKVGQQQQDKIVQKAEQEMRARLEKSDRELAAALEKNDREMAEMRKQFEAHTQTQT